MKKLTFLCLFINSMLSAQPDTVFLSFPSPTEINSFNGGVLGGSSGYTVLTQNYNDQERYYSVSKTDLSPNLTSSIDELKVNGFTIEKTVFFPNSTGGYFLLALFENGNDENNLFISFYANNEFSTILPIDTILLDKSETLYGVRYKYYASENEIEGFGVVRNVDTNGLIDNIYLKTDSNGYFTDNQRVDFFAQPSYVSDFVRIPETGQYMVSFFDKKSLLMDSGFNIVNSIVNLFAYEEGGVNYTDAFSFTSCEHVNGGIICSGLSSAETSYNISWVRLAYENDTLILDKIVPVLSQTTNDDLVLANLIEDNEGNWICIGNGFFWAFGNSIESNNLYISKLTPQGEIIWSSIFNNGEELVIYDAITDVNNDIVIVGAYASESFAEEYKNFLFKINNDGTLTDTKYTPPFSGFINIYPNPASDYLTIKFNCFDKKLKAHISSVDGKTIKSSDLQSPNESIYIGDLTTGQYVIIFENENGDLFSSAKFIKH